MLQEPLVTNATVHEFLDSAAARTPTPGGGGIAAVAGALAASMAEMALAFTVGNKRYSDVEAEAKRLREEIGSLRAALEAAVAQDAEGYGGVAAALKMPRAAEEEKAARKEALDDAMREALGAPLEMVRAIRSLAGLLERVLEISNRNLSGDVAVAAALAPGAAKAAALNVWANVSALSDEKRREVSAEVFQALEEIDRTARLVYGKVEDKLCPKEPEGPTSA